MKYGIPQGAVKDEWSIGYTSQFTIATWSGYTSKYQEQGYYIPINSITSYTQAFQISHYMLDFCQKYGTYSDISPTSGVSHYNGGYIETQYLSQGDKTKSTDSDPDTSTSTQTQTTTDTNTNGSGETDDDVNNNLYDNSGSTDNNDYNGGYDYNGDQNNQGGGDTDYYGLFGFTKKSLFNLFNWL